MDYLNSLNEQQRAAVEHGDGPLLVFAGAGSGKTRVITYRIACLIRERNVPPWNILAVTFTNKAAAEMRHRLEALLGTEAEGLWVGTFHATCARMLRESGAAIGIPGNFVVYDDGEQVDLVKKALRQLNIDEKAHPPRPLLYAISAQKEKLVGPEQFAKRASGYYEELLAQVYARYSRLLKESNALDFDDLLCAAIHLLEESPEALTRYQNKFQHVLVDEYQDANYVQYKLVHLLTEKSRNLCVVGDDDQSIYSFRGARVELILEFERDHPDAKVIKLEQNYRSTQRILDAAHSIVRKNASRAAKKLWTDRQGGTPVTLTQADDDATEARMVAEYIRRKQQEGERTAKEFAVLYRTNAQSRQFEETFLRYRIPHRVVGALRFYERKVVKDLMAYLRLIVNPDDALALVRCLSSPPKGIGDTSVQRLDAYAREREISLWQAACSREGQMLLPGKPASALRTFIEKIKNLQAEAERSPVSRVLRQALVSSGYEAWLDADDSQEGEDRKENARELENVAAQFEEQSNDKSTLAFVQQTALASDLDSVDDEAGQALLMTLHTAKGLEFPVVFIAGLEEGLTPHMRSELPHEIEEERRLVYVGMTRAREELHLLTANSRRFNGVPRWSRPSRFLRDLPPGGTTTLLNLMFGQYVPDRPPEPTERPQPVKVAADAGLFPPSSVAVHPKYGEGIVTKCEPSADGDLYVTLVFPGEIGIKTVLASVAKLEPLSGSSR